MYKIYNTLRIYFQWLKLAFTNSKALSYYPIWNQQKMNKNLENIPAIPWITYEAKDWLEKNLNKSMNVFEWGSGGSTLYFLSKVSKVISVEHNEQWYTKAKNEISKKGYNNYEYYLEKAESPKDAKYASTDADYLNLNFQKYVNRINSYPDEFFDLVVVDGRARVSCVEHAVNKIKKGGYLLLDNSERKEYGTGMDKLNNFERHDFWGPGPYNAFFWKTTIFIKK